MKFYYKHNSNLLQGLCSITRIWVSQVTMPISTTLGSFDTLLKQKSWTSMNSQTVNRRRVVASVAPASNLQPKALMNETLKTNNTEHSNEINKIKCLKRNRQNICHQGQFSRLFAIPIYRLLVRYAIIHRATNTSHPPLAPKMLLHVI